MNRKELHERIHPLSQFELTKKQNFEETGELYVAKKEHNQWWEKDSSGYYIFSNKVMSNLDNAHTDPLHAPMSHPIIHEKLRLILHSRYSYIPFHSNEFVSVNFVYSGHLIIDFPDRRIILQKGQIIFMNNDIVHSLTFNGTDDIIMGFQIEKAFLNENLLYGLRGSGPVADFLIASMTGYSNEFSYLISGFENDDKMTNLFEDIFCEYLDPGIASDLLVENYVRIFFSYLIRSSSNIIKTNTKANLIDILSHIDEHYADCSLQQLSQIFHFSSKYLGNLIKKKTGYTFQQLLENARMNKICYYPEHSELPVREIAQNCGYSNLTFFFRRFDERYHLTPAMYRRKIKNRRSL
jgi:AraC-like DNA-binding protein